MLRCHIPWPPVNTLWGALGIFILVSRNIVRDDGMFIYDWDTENQFETYLSQTLTEYKTQKYKARSQVVRSQLTT